MRSKLGFTAEAPAEICTANLITERAAALQATYDAYVKQIYRFIFVKVGNREDAEDITSQVFIKAAKSLDITREGHIQLTWLYRVARTTMTDHWREHYRSIAISLDTIDEGSLHLAGQSQPTYSGVHEAAEVDRAIAKVHSILVLLPKNYRRVLELRFLKGCSVRETAAVMKVTETNAKVTQHRAIQKAMEVGAALIKPVREPSVIAGRFCLE